MRRMRDCGILLWRCFAIAARTITIIMMSGSCGAGGLRKNPVGGATDLSLSRTAVCEGAG